MKRKVYPGKIHHVYQKTRNGGLLFYSPIDYLVYTTIFCAMAERMDVEVLAFCPMVDHIHHVLRVTHRDLLFQFEQQHSRLFALEWNRSHNTKGQVFRHCYGSAVKMGDKNIRSVLAYNYNNPVERKMVSRAEEYRWNLLAYARSDHPFSQPLDLPRCSKHMRRILQEVRACRKQGLYLRYAQLERWFARLNAEESQQLTDFILSQWNIVNYEVAASHYPSFEAMVRAFHDNTGSEYDIVEEKDNWSDAVYQDCTRILLAGKLIGHVREIPCLADAHKQHCYQLLQQRTTARPKQLCKYLHLPAAPTY
ncbi:MAG: transposase [Bacteroidales bacterium]|nr:transposase [Bacteroidales bacterium]